MGAINYDTSDYITIGLEPYDERDFRNDADFMAELEAEVKEYGGTVEEALTTYLQDCYEDDLTNIQALHDKFDFCFFHVAIKPGYYEGFYIDIENNYGLAYDCWQDKREAQKEITQIKEFLISCVNMGLCQCFPGWCTVYPDRAESLQGIDAAVREMRDEVRRTPTVAQMKRRELELA